MRRFRVARTRLSPARATRCGGHRLRRRRRTRPRAQSRTADRTIRAPSPGSSVCARRARSFVAPATLSARSTISPDRARFDVTETQIARLAPRRHRRAHGRLSNQRFTAHIAQVDSRIAAQSRTVRVRALLPNGDEQLRSGILVTVDPLQSPAGAGRSGIAIIDQADSAYVFTVGARDECVRRLSRRASRQASGSAAWWKSCAA